MFRQPASRTRTANRLREDDGDRAASLAESLGITRFFGQTYVVGGNAYASLADAVAQGRHLQLQAAEL